MSIHLTQTEIQASTLVDIVRWRAVQQPFQLAYTFLEYKNERCQEKTFTYKELDRQARSIGAMLERMNAFQKPVLLLFHSGLDYVAAFFGCLYAGAIAVPAYPPRHSRSVDRIQSILEDAQPELILTTGARVTGIQQWLTTTPALAVPPVISIDTLDVAQAALWKEPELSADHLALLQYTSGSTSNPRGVMVSHSNIMHNAAAIQQYTGYDIANCTSAVCISWLPIYHDMGLIANILEPAYVGYPVIFMDPVQFLQFPMRWLYAISHYRGTISYAPDFAYNQCIRRVKPQDIAALDLSSWQLAINGSETIRSETLDHFTDVFQACGFQRKAFKPSYGLAEGTLVVTSQRIHAYPVERTFDKQMLEKNKVATVAPDSPHSQKLISSGIPPADMTLVIVRPEKKHRCLPDEIGEIWLQSKSITQGYWHRPEETEQVFRVHLQDCEDGPFLRTGDLGFLHEGYLYVTGRIKDLIIINGRNHYPQDIELTVEKSHPAIRPACCVAFPIEHEGKENLVVMAEIDPRYRSQPDSTRVASLPDPQDLIKSIRQQVAEEHDVHIYKVVLLAMGEVLKTSSGKIQRRACRTRYLANELKLWKVPS